MTPVLDGRSWLGDGIVNGNPVRVELSPSLRRAGCYHLAVAIGGRRSESGTPFEGKFLQENLGLVLEDQGLSGEVMWRAVGDREFAMLDGGTRARERR